MRPHFIGICSPFFAPLFSLCAFIHFLCPSFSSRSTLFFSLVFPFLSLFLSLSHRLPILLSFPSFFFASIALSFSFLLPLFPALPSGSNLHPFFFTILSFVGLATEHLCLFFTLILPSFLACFRYPSIDVPYSFPAEQTNDTLTSYFLLTHPHHSHIGFSFTLAP